MNERDNASLHLKNSMSYVGSFCGIVPADNAVAHGFVVIGFRSHVEIISQLDARLLIQSQ